MLSFLCRSAALQPSSKHNASHRVSKRTSKKPKLLRKAQKYAKKAKVFLSELADSAPSMCLFGHEMDVDTEADKEAYDLREKYRQVYTGFELWRQEEDLASFENPEHVSAAKGILDEAKDLLELSDPGELNVNDLWNLSYMRECSEFLEGTAETTGQKQLKKTVDKIIRILLKRRNTHRS